MLATYAVSKVIINIAYLVFHTLWYIVQHANRYLDNSGFSKEELNIYNTKEAPHDRTETLIDLSSEFPGDKLNFADLSCCFCNNTFFSPRRIAFYFIVHIQ